MYMDIFHLKRGPAVLNHSTYPMSLNCLLINENKYTIKPLYANPPPNTLLSKFKSFEVD